MQRLSNRNEQPTNPAMAREASPSSCSTVIGVTHETEALPDTPNARKLAGLSIMLFIVRRIRTECQQMIGRPAQRSTR